MADAARRFAGLTAGLLLFFDLEKNGILEVLQEALVENTRLESGRKAQPTAGVIDSQSIKFYTPS